MSVYVEPLRCTVWENQSLVVFARIANISGDYITQATITSIAGGTYDLDDGSAVATFSVVVGSSVFDTLQTGDARWTVDSTGYNFRHTVPGTALPEGDKRYQVEIVLTPTGGADPIPLIVWAKTREVYSL